MTQSQRQMRSVDQDFGELGGGDILSLIAHERGQHIKDCLDLGKGIYNTRFKYNAYLRQFQLESWKNTYRLMKMK
ncbi:hypothetical protein D0817_05205 [Flavobacterium cupreum]|uniref:Uncharacterized protein n=1 Tax=Flavobacterium cupreum TaxID=2133766 RepID=A0A434AA82_9FLAO|nr:hypothetical protein D0817_05205 [Flavobacterium cupreum]